ncbi:MAG: Fis family transcriptional regulator, partial [Burkholderiales bacterium]|nr:Fis family transcriptional regulator [Burkholderiales bacterium]
TPSASEVPTTVTEAASSIDNLPKKVDAYEASLITDALRAQNGNVALTADRLGIPKKTLYDKLKKYQISLS